jgi:hypothetical protein
MEHPDKDVIDLYVPCGPNGLIKKKEDIQSYLTPYYPPETVSEILEQLFKQS